MTTSRILVRPTLLGAALVAGLCGCQQLANTLPKGLTGGPDSAHRTAGKEPSVDALVAEARALDREGQVDQAIKAYAAIVQRDPARSAAYHRLGVLYDKKGDHERSARSYEMALQLDPLNAELHCDYGYSCYLQRRWKEAEKALRTALRLNPGLARAHNNLGLLLARTGRDREALGEFAKAGCTEAETRSNLAIALAIEQRWNETQSQRQPALAANPAAKPAGGPSTRLTSLRSPAQTTPGMAMASDGG